jgi:hypothetical protein
MVHLRFGESSEVIAVVQRVVCYLVPSRHQVSQGFGTDFITQILTHDKESKGDIVGIREVRKARKRNSIDSMSLFALGRLQAMDGEVVGYLIEVDGDCA